MIADLLDHTNAELNQMKVNRKEVYWKEYLDALAKELEIYCEKWGCTFTYENEFKECLVIIDSTRITQVIYNLVENACKYMEQKGEFGQETKAVRLLCNACEEEKKIVVSVIDNGPGIAMADLPFVFERFYRAEKSRSMQIPGAGLGLSICRHIIMEHDGDITIKSHVNIGTEVSSYLNINQVFFCLKILS